MTRNKNPFLDRFWLNNHLDQIQKIAGPRYIPKLNVELPICEIFNGISRTKSFYHTLRRHYGKLAREFNRITSGFDKSKLKNLYKNFKNEITSLSDFLSEIIEYDSCIIPWNDIHKHSKKSQELLWILLEELRKAKEEVEKDRKESHSPSLEKYNSAINYLFETQKELLFFEELSSSSKAKLSNNPFLLLTGSAGTGKTHLLCDITRNRIGNGNYYPAILLFGELFYDGKGVWSRVIKQLKLTGEFNSKSKLLHYLDKAGEKSKCRTLFMIDALNETHPLDFWRKNLDSIIEEIRKYTNIALVISIRSGFEDDILTEEQKQNFIQEEHLGFRFKEWEAVTKFFNEFFLPLPEVPLLMPEFQNPLFLLLFCKAFQRRAKENQKRGEKRQIFKGHEGTTYIFENFVKEMADKIASEFGLPKGRAENGDYVIWDTIIEKIATEMAEQGKDRIEQEKFRNIVSSTYPSIDTDKFIQALERNLLIIKVPRYTKEGKTKGFNFRFPFQKFSDHLIGRYIFKKYRESNKTLRQFFAKNTRIGKFISQPWNKGIVEALSIQTPEQLKGVEFVEVAPYLQDSQVAQEAFVESIIWRNPSAFIKDLKNTINYINEKIIKTSYGYNQLLNAFISVAPIPKHPFNANFLYHHLSKFSMPKRDAYWSTFLHYQYREQEAVDRLLQWAWSDQDKSSICDDSIFLILITLSWVLTTPNRFVRDKATKGLVCLLQNKIHLITRLLKKFKDVNDPYILERIYAVAYGCVLRNQDDNINLEKLALWIYDNIFKDNKPPIHILLRDYARGVIEKALNRGIELEIDENNINPPYQSEWFEKIPNANKLKEKYYPEDFFNGKTKERGYLDIWFSVMHNFGSLGDFGNYVINSHLRHWSGRRISDLSLEHKRRVLQEFENSLSDNQKELFEKCKRIKTLAKISGLIKNEDVENISLDIKELKSETKENNSMIEKEFKEALSKEQRKHFEKNIEPFLNKNYEIKDDKEHFDTGLAQRWIFNRVIELGWDPKLHGKFDNNINRFYNRGRSEHKAERIGKKYQWIAYHEFLARVSDNFQLVGESWNNNIKEYKGPWYPYVRDIDPSIILQNDSHIRKTATFDQWKGSKGKYDAWKKKLTDIEWMKKTDDLPKPEDIIHIKDDNSQEWLVLVGSLNWEEDTPPEIEKFDIPIRKLYYMIKSYIVKKKDIQKVFVWAKEQDFMGGWMPEYHGFDECFLGEFPNSLAFNDLRGDYNAWTKDIRNNRNIPTPVVTTADSYFLSEFLLDCSYDTSMSIRLPCKWLVNKMGLQHKYLDGRFFDKKGELIGFETSIFEENFPSALLIKKQNFYDFLSQNGYAIFWTLVGEKQMIGGEYSNGKWIGRLELSGAYMLNKKKKIIGKFNTNLRIK